VGKYRVNLEDLDLVGAQSINTAIDLSDVVVVDEIGPMELFSSKFKEAAKKALESDKLVIAVVHYKAQDELVRDTKSRLDAETFEVTLENRENLSENS
jgi:nucleoside-triphosphatase